MAPSAPRPGCRPARHRPRVEHRRRPRGPPCPSTLPGVVVLLAGWLPGTPLVGLGLLVPGAIVVGGERLTRATGGPDIHDRQLDRIVAALVATAAPVLLAVAWPVPWEAALAPVGPRSGGGR